MDIIDELSKPFPQEVIHWRVGATTKDKSNGIALAYIDARDVMDRLDSVVGAGRWQCRYPFPGCCEIGICVTEQDSEGFAQGWVWKSNGAGETDYEGTKGMYSDAFKRAAVMWGIGRYLYSLPNVWVPIEPAGRSYKIKEPPKLPKWAIPQAQHGLPSGGSMNGEKLDEEALLKIVDKCIAIVDDPDNDLETGAPKARAIYEPLSNDARGFVNKHLGKRTFKNPSTGRDNAYWTAFKKYLEAAA